MYSNTYGIQFWRFPGYPLADLEKDMDLYKSLGFQTIRLQQVWSADEPEEGNVKPDQITALLEASRARGLKVIITFTLEAAPVWLYRKYPDAYYVNGRGEKFIEHNTYPLPSDGKPGPCWDHPGVRKEAERFIAAFMSMIAPFEHITSWSAWQEASVWVPSDSHRSHRAKLYCLCAHTLSDFEQWLQRRYGHLNTLNEKWLTNYKQWEGIEPTRSIGGVPANMDWHRYMMERLGRIAGWKKDIIRAHDPLQRPVSVHTVGSVTETGIGKWDHDVHLAKGMDYFGKSLYPAWMDSDPLSHQQYISFSMDSCRGALEPGTALWASEIQGGRSASGFFYGPVPSGRDMINWTLATVGAGAKGLIWWANREELILNEAYGHGLLDRLGRPMPWLAELSSVVSFLQQYDQEISDCNPVKSEVAIVINMDNYILAHNVDKGELAVKSAQLLHGFLLEQGIYPDFLWAERLELDNWTDYKVILLPLPVTMSRKLADKIRAYVDAGGTVISEAGLAIYDEYSSGLQQELPGFELHEVFGCRASLTYGEDESSLNGTGTFHGFKITNHVMIQTYQIDQGTPIFHSSHGVSGVANVFGSGKTFLIGTLFSHLLKETSVQRLLKQILNDSGINVENTKASLRIRNLEGTHFKIQMVYNATSEKQYYEIPSGRLIGLFGGTREPYRLSLEGHSTACLIYGC